MAGPGGGLTRVSGQAGRGRTSMSGEELPCRLFPGETTLRNPNGRVSRYIPAWPVVKVIDLKSCALSNYWGYCEAGHTLARLSLITRGPRQPLAQEHGAGAIRDVRCSHSVTLRYMDIRSVRARYADICDS